MMTSCTLHSFGSGLNFIASRGTSASAAFNSSNPRPYSSIFSLRSCLFMIFSLFRFPQFHLVAIRVYEPAEPSILHFLNLANDRCSALLYLFKCLIQMVDDQVEHETFLRRSEIIAERVEHTPHDLE